MFSNQIVTRNEEREAQKWDGIYYFVVLFDELISVICDIALAVRFVRTFSAML